MTVNYELVEHDNNFHENHWAIRLLEGDYQNVVYQYDTVSISEPDESGQMSLNFNIVTIENPDNYDLTETDFKNTIGDILVKLIEENSENTIDGDELNGEDGTGSTEASAE